MTLLEAIAAAKDGDTIDATDFPAVTGLKSVVKAVTIRNARFTGPTRILGCKNITLEDFTCEVPAAVVWSSATNAFAVEACDKVTLRRGKVLAGSMQGRALLISRSTNITTEDMDVSGTARGVYVDLCSDITLTRTVAHNLRSDGLDISRTSRLLVNGLEVNDIDIGDSGAHPDIVQIINSPTNPGTCSDITIRGVKSQTKAQGINLFDHDRGGADRITIEDCDLLVGYYHAINMENVRGLTLRNIRYGPMPGIDPKIKPWCHTNGCTDVVMENVVGGWDGSEPVKLPEVIEITLLPGQRLIVTA